MLDAPFDLDLVDDAALDEVFQRPGQMLRADAIHGCAEAAGVIQRDDLFALRGKALGEAVDEMDFGTDGEHRTCRGVLDELDEALGRAEGVGLLADLPAAFGMDDDLNAGILGADLIDVAGQEALMDGAVAFPEDDATGFEGGLGLPALQRPRVPDRHRFEGDIHGVAGVAAEMLIGEKENALAALESPFKGGAGVGTGADQAAAFAAEGFDGGGGVHVGERDQAIGQADLFESFPGGFYLGDFGHVGHGAAGVQVGQDHLLDGVALGVLAAEQIGAFSHKMHAAEDDVFGFSLGGDFGELVAVAGCIGKANDFIALVVVAEQEHVCAEFLTGRCDAVVHGVIGQREIVLETAGFQAGRVGRRDFLKYRNHRIPPSVQQLFWNSVDGDVESKYWLQWIHCPDT